MRFAPWFRPSAIEADAHRLYGRLVEQARAPGFYGAGGVPDSLDGRYEMVVLHVFLALRRLKREGAAAGARAQALFDAMFADMDRSLREIGVGDLSVGKRVKEMARGLYGRIAAYEAGLERPDDDALEQALKRNVYGTVATPAAPAPARLARYVRAAAASFEALPVAALDGNAALPWPAPPSAAEAP
jgi:cytochrome b pre-mRNA-processing protein 3